MALSGATQPSPQVIGAAFVQQYYYVLHQSPDQAHKFYQDSSILSRPDPNGMMISGTIMQASNDKLLSLDFSNFIAEIESVDAQASHKDGILVVVTGTLTGRHNIRHKFMQSFFLAPQERGGYVVLNDIFRFVDLCQPIEVNQVLLNGTNHDALAASLTPEPEPILVLEPLAANAVEHEAALSMEDPDTGDEVHKPPENGTSEVEDDAATDTEVCLSQSDDQPASSDVTAISQEGGPKKSYASIVKVYKGSLSQVPTLVSVSKPKPALLKIAPPKPSAVNPENQPAPSSMPSTSEAPVLSSKSAPKSNSCNAAEGHSIYIRNLPLSTTPEQVMEEFKKFGSIKPDGVQVRNHKVERFCFGFVEFELLDSMIAAIKASPINIGGRHAYIEEKRTTTRVVNGVVTNSGNGGERGRYQQGRGGYWNDNFRGRVSFGNQGYVRTEFRNRGEYSGRGHGGPGHPSSSYQQRPLQNGTGRMFGPHEANQTAVSA